MLKLLLSNKLFCKIVSVLLLGITAVFSQECLSRDYGNGGTVCVCNEGHCDIIPPVGIIPPNHFVTYTSNKGGLRFKKEIKCFMPFPSPPPSRSPKLPSPIYPHNKRYLKEYHKNVTNKTVEECLPEVHVEYEVCGTSTCQESFKEWHHVAPKRITIDPSRIYQKILGFGGAFTDATAININSLSENLHNYLMRSYFSEEGIEYNLCRVPMGGTDFSTHAYSYVDSIEREVNCVDLTLSNFNLTEEDYLHKIPLILEANILSSRNLELFTSTWVAPRAYKENNNYRGTMGFIKKSLYQLWADYFVKFLDSYLTQGIPFWGISTGNEPFIAMLQYSGIPGVLWFPDDQGKWIRENLVPTLRKSVHKNINVITLDDQRPLLLNGLPKVLAGGTDHCVQGVGLHWYMDYNNNTYLLREFHKLYPYLFLLATEGCAGDFENNIRLGAWDRAEKYAWNIAQDLNNWVTGWVDWNMVLDTDGGPRIAGAVDAPIIVNETYTEFYKQPTFYAMGHFSKFIPKGSVRIYSTQCDTNGLTDIVAFKKPDGGIVIVFVNRSEYAVRRVFVDRTKGEIYIAASPHSITTILY